jgi:hypothetical protein
MKLTFRTLAIPTALAACAVAAPVAGAQGGDPADKPVDPGCNNPAGTKVFEQFRDRRNYFLAPDGGFEGGAAGWTLDGASVVDGNESFNLGGAADSKSLSLPAGSSALSPAFCIQKGHPMFRFVAKRNSGTKKARLRVNVVYLDGKGRKRSRRAGKLRAGETWKPTKKLAFALGRAFGKRRKSGNVKLKFTPVGNADWQIDDVYIDPRSRR